MQKWGDAKRSIFEDMLVYASIILYTLMHDFFMNLLVATHLNQGVHPYKFGAGQILAVCIAGHQLIRKIDHWRYYK